MSDVVLATLNARYHHAAFGLRYLLANMGELQPRTVLREFTINQSTIEILERLLEDNPRIVGLGVYIWNVEQTTRLVADLKRVRPEITVVLGGPEVSYETAEQEIVRLADYVITGEADVAFAALCRQILRDERPAANVITAALPVLSELQQPYDLYDADDIRNRVVYVEASRGCPFTCEFCLSALDIPVRQFPLPAFLSSLASLHDRGVTRFKFVDRTFNLNLRTGTAILEFFLERLSPDLFLHFEMIPDRLPHPLREVIRRFPPGMLQFEVGIQTFNDEVSVRISRKQDNAKAEDNLRFLREETGVHLHADLIVGLPGETVASFATGFDRLVALRPQEIQIGILKRLRGTPIVRHDVEWGMIYSPHSPYEILQNRTIDFSAMTQLRRFARYWDLVVNSGNFAKTTPLIWGTGSPFAEFSRFSEFLFTAENRTHGIPLVRLAEHLFVFLTQCRSLDEEHVAEALWADYRSGGRHDRPRFLRRFDLPMFPITTTADETPQRQSRHITASNPITE